MGHKVSGNLRPRSRPERGRVKKKKEAWGQKRSFVLTVEYAGVAAKFNWASLWALNKQTKVGCLGFDSSLQTNRSCLVGFHSSKQTKKERSVVFDNSWFWFAGSFLLLLTPLVLLAHLLLLAAGEGFVSAISKYFANFVMTWCFLSISKFFANFVMTVLTMKGRCNTSGWNHSWCWKSS